MHAALAVTLLLVVPVSAQAPAQDILKRVDDRYNHLASLSAHFTEQYQGMGLTRTEGGDLLLKKPGRMLWRYSTPAGKVFVLDGHDAWFYTPGDAQAQRTPAKKLDDLRSPLRFLLGHTQLAKELDTIQVVPEEGGYRITGVPRGQSGRIRLLTLSITPDGLIAALRIDEQDGSSTSFTFDHVVPNAPARDADFRFSPPAGVPVVDALPPV